MGMWQVGGAGGWWIGHWRLAVACLSLRVVKRSVSVMVEVRFLVSGRLVMEVEMEMERGWFRGGD